MAAKEALSRRNMIGIVGAIACISVFALTIGLTYPLLAFILAAQGYGETAIGFNAATHLHWPRDAATRYLKDNNKQDHICLSKRGKDAR